MKDELVFWGWFEQNEARFRNIQVDEKEQLLDELLEALHTCSTNLWFETGKADDGVNELIISAEGRREHFSAVRILVAAAPKLPGWRFIAFKPAEGFDFNTQYANITFSPKATWFMPLRSSHDPAARGLRVGYAHFDTSRAKDFLTGTIIMLEGVLGEMTLAECVHHIEVVALPSSPESSGFLPLTEIGEWLGDTDD